MYRGCRRPFIKRPRRHPARSLERHPISWLSAGHEDALDGGMWPLPSAAVISTNQFKNGTHIEVDGTIYRIVEFQHVKPGKGGAFVRTKLRRYDDGSVQDKAFRAGEKFRPVRTETRRMQYLYDSGEAAVFMDSDTYDQLEIPRDAAGEDMRWVLPNDTVEILF